MGEVINYKRWAINQRIKELMKAIRRVPSTSILSKQRQIELENLNKELESLND